MTILGIQPAQDVYTTPFVRESSSGFSAPPIVRNTEADTVKISDEAMKLAQKDQAEKSQGTNAASQSNGALPLRAYSIPGWMSDLTPALAKVEPAIGRFYTETNQARRAALSPSEKDDLSEYMHTLRTTYNEESRSTGIENAEDYYNSIVLNKKPGLSEELRKAVQQRLSEDPRMMELMHEFGISA